MNRQRWSDRASGHWGKTWCPSFICSAFHHSILWVWSPLQPRVRAFALPDSVCGPLLIRRPVSQGLRCLSGELLPLVLVPGLDSSLVWPGLTEERIGGKCSPWLETWNPPLIPSVTQAQTPFLPDEASGFKSHLPFRVTAESTLWSLKL